MAGKYFEDLPNDIEELYKESIRERAKLLGISEEEVRKEAESSEPRFMIAARRKAERLGKTVEEVLEDDLEAMRNSNYPGPDCLNPGEADRYLSQQYSPEQNKLVEDHLEKCEGCKSLIEFKKSDDT